ncbi:Na(+)/H(+) exchange regulatory cofactor NHE-RF4 [Merluccius polli]|uniref:Na(+)/H(+) exchange regulatory cofactor NHE-RF4 n=1 Tax=Merluccius polli TaxID=89951 RepID=A0AA47NXM0_MERPO|nr:Na(+)/H(+) exchange regulatory cofactor NHE-RF4 [Merluccius polli]
MALAHEYVSGPTPRLCVLRRDEGEAYGFHLLMERGRGGHLVRRVKPRGVAERSGLRDGDRILEVNGRFVDDVPHPEVARRIRISGNQLCVLVLDGEGYERAEAQGHDLLALVKSHEMEGCKSPRLCHVTRNHSGLGVSFTPVEGERGRFSVSLVSGGAAERAGVCRGDRLVWMNGAAVSDLTHSALTRMVKRCGDSITILVVDRETEEKYIQQKKPLLPAMALPCNLPHRARSRRLTPGPQGYGFLLREESASGRTVQVVREVDAGSPAQRAGMQDGELLLEVNWESVEALAHEDVVARVKESGPRQVTLTTVSAQGLDFYSKLGLSPVLFCGDEAVREKQPENDDLLPAVAEETPEEVAASLRASSEESVASLPASSEEVVASRSASSEEAVASRSASSEEVAASLRASSEESIASLPASSEEVVASRSASSEEAVASRSASSEEAVASLCASSEEVASRSASSEEVVASRPASSEEAASRSAPRHCVIEKGPLGFGFDFDCVQHTSGTFVSQVTPGGPGHRAGLAEGDVVVEVNGHNVEGKHLEDVVMMIEAAGSQISLVVMSRGHHRNDINQTCSTADVDSEVRSQHDVLRIGRTSLWRLFIIVVFFSSQEPANSFL